MSLLHVTDQEQATDRTRRPHRVPVLWPWLLVAVAWAVLVLATLTHQTFLLDHHYLLQASGLPWLAALEVFLLCWQVMTVAMMLPSSMPMVNLVVYAGRKQAHPVAVPLAFLAHWGGDVRQCRSVPVQPSQGALPGHVPHATGVLPAPLPQGGWSCVAPGLTPWRILPGLLLGLDAGHVRGRRGQSGRDGSAYWGHGDRKSDARREASESTDRHRSAAVRDSVAGASSLATKCWSMRSMEVPMRELLITDAERALRYLEGLNGRGVAPDPTVVARLAEPDIPLSDHPSEAGETLALLDSY